MTVVIVTVVIVTVVTTSSVVVTETFNDFFWVFTVAVTFMSRFAGAFAFRSCSFTLSGLSTSPESAAASTTLAFVAINVEVNHGEPASIGERDQAISQEIIFVAHCGCLKDSLLNQCVSRHSIGEVKQGFRSAAA